MNFWRSTVDQLYDNIVPQHPVAVQLYSTIQEHNVSKQLLHR